MILILSFADEGEKYKFDYIYEHYKRLMLYKAREILKDPMLAEDAVSEALLRVYRNLHKIEDPASNKALAFVMTIVKNSALTILKKQSNTLIEPLIESKEDGFDLESFVVDDISSQAILGLLDGLGEELKSVFLLKFAYDLPHRQIGELLQISENNVTVRLHRAKKKLAQILVKEGYAHGHEK